MAAELASAKLNPESHLLLEQPLLRVPFELSRKTFKSAQRHVERERIEVPALLNKAAQECRSAQSNSSTSSSSQNGHTPATDSNALNNLDNIIHRMENLKRKLETLHTEEQNTHRATRARIEHLQALHDIPSLADVKYEEWSKIRLIRLLVDYLLRQGYTHSASTFAKATKITDLVDISAFEACARIEACLGAHQTKEALAWCSENRGALKKMGSLLEFELRLQQYIELVRTGHPTDLLEAAVHARRHFRDQEAEQVVKAAGLLAYPADTEIEPYKSLYAPTRWPYLKTLFTRTHHTLLSLPASPALHVALSAGLSALKTPACHSIHAASSGNVSTATSGTSVCPICSTELNELARNVPYAHHTKSYVEDDPVVLPNGRVYGRERLRRLNEKMGGPGVGGMTTVIGVEFGPGGANASAAPIEVVRDPMNPNEFFMWEEVRKVYIS